MIYLFYFVIRDFSFSSLKVINENIDFNIAHFRYLFIFVLLTILMIHLDINLVLDISKHNQVSRIIETNTGLSICLTT